MSLERITGQRVVDELKAGHMVYLLHRAGWSHEKIADEMGTTVKTVATGLSKLRKKTENSVEPGDDMYPKDRSEI